MDLYRCELALKIPFIQLFLGKEAVMQIFLQAALGRQTEDAAVSVEKKKSANLQVWKNKACYFNESNRTVPNCRCEAGAEEGVFIV